MTENFNIEPDNDGTDISFFLRSNVEVELHMNLENPDVQTKMFSIDNELQGDPHS